MLNPDLMPDITVQHKSNEPLTLQWVGMEGVAIPLTLNTEAPHSDIVTAKADLYVSLDSADAKGIHMSRLYSLLNDFSKRPLLIEEIELFIDQLIQSQGGNSNNAKVRLSFDVLRQKRALISQETGYQAYPVVIVAKRVSGKFQVALEFTVTYSSTCPCSASLARQLYCSAIDKRFSSDTIDKQSLLDWVQSGTGSIASPHSQRSFAFIKMAITDTRMLDVRKYIEKLELLIRTPVQTAVKRSDEQEFARLNAENLMFCEDAARSIKAYLESVRGVDNYWFKVEHQESLHPHNVVVVDQKYPLKGAA